MPIDRWCDLLAYQNLGARGLRPGSQESLLVIGPAGTPREGMWGVPFVNADLIGSKVVFVEHSDTNRVCLRTSLSGEGHIAYIDQRGNPQVMDTIRPYKVFDDLYRELGGKAFGPEYAPYFKKSFARTQRLAILEAGNVYNLGEDKRGAVDIVVMTSVACSITDKPWEMALAVLQAINAVRPGGYIYFTFVEQSKGYETGDIKFPGLDWFFSQYVNFFSSFLPPSCFNIALTPMSDAGMDLPGRYFVHFTAQLPG